MTMTEAQAHHRILMAVTLGQTFEDSGVPDTPHNRDRWATVAAEVAALPPGAMVDIPFDYGLWDDEDDDEDEPVQKKFHADQPRGADGRWTHVMDLGTARDVVRKTRKNGGHSVHPATGKEPKTGYMVGQQGKDAVHPWSEFRGRTGAEHLRKFADEHREDFDSDTYLGTWLDDESGKVALDISKNVQDLEDAKRMGRENDQKAIYDVVNGKEIPTGGTGGDLSKSGGYVPLEGVSPAIKGLHRAAWVKAHPEDSPDPDYDDSDENWDE